MCSGLKTGKERSGTKRQKVHSYQDMLYTRKMSKGLRVTWDMSENCLLTS